MKKRMQAVNVAMAALIVAGCTKQTDSRADAPGVPTGDTAVAASGAGSPISMSPERRAEANYVGLRYEDLPKGFRYHAGAVITPSPVPGADYAFSQVSTPKGEMIWLDSLGASIRNGDRARTVRAALVVPPLAQDERLFMASCDARGKLDPMVVAIVVNEPNASRFTQIRQAWRADAGASRFDVIPVDGVVCEEPGT